MDRNDLPGYQGPPPGYGDGGFRSDTPNSRVRMMAQQLEETNTYKPPSTPHRSYRNGGPADSPSRAGTPQSIRGAQYAPSSIASPSRQWTPSQAHRERERPWTPSSRVSVDWSRPAPSVSSYEPQDLNGAPRPGTPGQYSAVSASSSRRPLPPAPLFGGPKRNQDIESSLGDHDTTDYETETETYLSDSYDEDDDESVFGPDKSHRSLRSKYGKKGHRSVASVSTEGTITMDPVDEAYDEDDDDDDDLKKEEDIVDERDRIIDAEGEHYGPAPAEAQQRRSHKAQLTKKQVRLIGGELILECKIPTILYSFLPRRDELEFTSMRYTAVTCDPDAYCDRGYTLRQNIDKRETELFICITMYNEDEHCFTRTMHGVMRNIAHMCSRKKSRVWGKDGWQKIVVCIVADGRKKIHPRVLDALAAMGCYQDGIAKNLVNGREVTAHVYEYTTQVSLDSDLKFKGAEKGIVPVQTIFCLKEKNAKKLNSHRWFFNAFGASLNPNVCILLDVGTRPGSTSLYHLWKAFDTNSDVAGACGEIKAMKGKGGIGLLNPLVASQNFEYKMSNILDKPLESVFGYITVLPGALSAYRYHALQNDPVTGHGPLSQYFKGETLHGKDADVFTANMYLAEDRILCWELVAKRGERWILKYVKSATGETDVPDAVPEFVSQRRRWLNGAFFAAVYSLLHFKQVWSTDHSIFRKILLHIEFIYQFISLLFTFFSLANFFLTFYFVAGSFTDPNIDPFGHGWGGRIFVLMKFIIILLISTQFIISLGNRPQGAKKLFFTSMVTFSVIMMYTTFCGFYVVIRTITHPEEGAGFKIGSSMFTNLVVSIASTMGLYFTMSLLYLEPWHMFTSSAQYFMMLPSYICTLQVYAFCNTHDVSWGTKGDNVVNTDLGAVVKEKGDVVNIDLPSEQLDIDASYDEALRNLRDRLAVPEPPVSDSQIKEDYYKNVRTWMVTCWMVANALLAMGITEIFDTKKVSSNFYLGFILWSVAGLACFRAIGSCTYAIMNLVHIFVEARYKMKVGEWRNPFRNPFKKNSWGGGSSLGSVISDKLRR